MGKKIIWSSDALDQLEDIHFIFSLKANLLQLQIK